MTVTWVFPHSPANLIRTAHQRNMSINCEASKRFSSYLIEIAPNFLASISNTSALELSCVRQSHLARLHSPCQFWRILDRALGAESSR